jgi:hypothetical protein
MADEKLFRIKNAYLPDEWISYEALIDALWNWAMYDDRTTSLLIFKREEEPPS